MPDRRRAAGVTTAAVAVLAALAPAPNPAAAAEGGLGVRYSLTGFSEIVSLLEVTGTTSAESVRVEQLDPGADIVVTSAPVDGGPPAPITSVTGCDVVGEFEVRCPGSVELVGYEVFLTMTPAEQADSAGAPDVVSYDLDDERIDVRVTGGAGADTVRGSTPGTGWIRGNGGDDEIFARPVQEDHVVGVQGGPGDDDLWSPYAVGGPGDDLLQAWWTDSRLFGGGGDDRLIGERGDDALRGGAGADVLRAGDGSDVVYGGRGDDRVRAADPTEPFDDDVNCGKGHDEVRIDWRDLTWRCEVVHGDRE